MRSLPVMSGILLGARQRELLLDDRLREDEPRVVVAGGEDRLQRRRGVVAGEARRIQPAAVRVQPQRRGARDDPDRVVGPDRVPVVQALGVVPHPVGVDHVRAGRLRDLQHPPVDVRGHAGDHVLRRRPEPVDRPVAADQLVVVPDPAAGDEHRRAPAARTRRSACGRTARRVRAPRAPAPTRGRRSPPRRRRSGRRPDDGTRTTRAPGARPRAPARGTRARPRAPCPRSDGSAAPSCRDPAPVRPRARPSRRAAGPAARGHAGSRASRSRRTRRRPRPSGVASSPRGGRTAPNPSSPGARARASP